MAYHDLTDQSDAFAGGEYRLVPDASLAGYATSDDGGESWTRRGHLPVSSTDPDLGRLFSDPWVDASGGTVLYTMMAAARGEVGSPVQVTGVSMSVSRDGGETFGEPFFIVRDPRVDGPRVAVSEMRDQALVTWLEGDDRSSVYYATLSAVSSPAGPILTPPRSFSPMITVFSSVLVAHPAPAVGPSGTWYVAVDLLYLSALMQRRLEVHRSRDGVEWERIISVERPPDEPGMQGVGALTERDAGPALAVSSDGSGDVVLLVAKRRTDPTATEPLPRQKVIQYRLPHADTCDAGRSDLDLRGCDPTLTDGATEPDLSAQLFIDGEPQGPLLAGRTGLFQNQPAVFAGGSGPDDRRVAIYWYVQPWRGVPSMPSRRGWTAVEGVVSNDAGETYRILNRITVPIPGIPSVIGPEADTGTFFEPCQTFDPDDPTEEGYFGHYNRGAFVEDDVDDLHTVGAWADSREGCLLQTPTAAGPTHHQHVFTGVWGVPRLFP